MKNAKRDTIYSDTLFDDTLNTLDHELSIDLDISYLPKFSNQVTEQNDEKPKKRRSKSSFLGRIFSCKPKTLSDNNSNYKNNKNNKK